MLFDVHEIAARAHRLLCASIGGLLCKWGRIRYFSSAGFSAASDSPAGNCEHFTFKRPDSIGKQRPVCGYGGQSFEYGCQLDRERRDGWRLGRRSDLKQRSLHRARRSASTSHRDDFCHEPRRSIRLWNCGRHNHKRYHRGPRSRSDEHRARGHAAIFRDRCRIGPSRSLGQLEFDRLCGRCLWLHHFRRHLYGSAIAADASELDAGGPKRGRP